MRERINFLAKLLGRLCVLGVVVGGPWRNSSTEPWVLRYFLILVLFSGAFALVSLWTTPSRERRMNKYFPTLLVSIPLLLGLFVCGLQMVRLPESVLVKLSPNIVHLRDALLPLRIEGLDLDSLYGDNGEDIARQASEIVDDKIEITNEYVNKTISYDGKEAQFDMRRALILDAAAEMQFLSDSKMIRMRDWGSYISVYPMVTHEQTPLFLTAFVLLLSSSVLFNTTESRRVLLKTIAFVGVAFGLVAISGRANPHLIERASDYFNLWWLKHPVRNYGTFINKNAAAGYLIMGFAACSFFMTREFMTSARLKMKDLETRKREEKEESREKVYKRKKSSSLLTWIGDLFDLFNRRLVFWLCMLSVTYAAILASLSRGGAIAATLALAVIVVATIFRRETRKFWFVPCLTLVLVLGALVSVSLLKNVDRRMGEITEVDEAGNALVTKDLRLQNWRDATSSVRDSFWLGSGLGAYSQANYRYDSLLASNRLFYYAENIFVQTLVEMGAVGLILLITEYALLFLLIGRLLTGQHSIETTALGLAAIAFLVGHLCSACFDFGIYLPGNLFLFSLMCGTFLGRQDRRLWETLTAARNNKRTAERATADYKKFSRREKLGMFVFSCLLLFLLLGTKWTLKENAGYIERSRLLKSVRDANIKTQEASIYSPTGLDGLIADLRRYVVRSDDCYEIRLALADLSITKFRLGYFDHLKKSHPNESAERLWEMTQPEYFLESLLGYQSIGFNDATLAIRDQKEIVEAMNDAASDLYAARRICPLYCRSFAPLVGYVSAASQTTWNDERQLMILYSLRDASSAPYDSQVFLKRGGFLGFFRLFELQREFLKRVVELSPQRATDALRILESGVPPAQLENAIDFIVEDDPYVVRVCADSFKSNPDAPVYKALQKKFDSILRKTPEENRDYRFNYNVGRFYNQSGDYDKAIDFLKKACASESSDDEAFFLRMQILCDHSKILQMDQECCDELKEYCSSHKGKNLWRAEELLSRAEKNLSASRARLESQERLRRERLMFDENAEDGTNEEKLQEPEEDSLEPPRSPDGAESRSEVSKAIDEIELLFNSENQ